MSDEDEASWRPPSEAWRRSVASSLRLIVIAGVLGMIYFATIGWYNGNAADQARAEKREALDAKQEEQAHADQLQAVVDGLVKENAMLEANLEQLKAHALQLTVILSAITGASDHTQVDESVLGNLGAVAATPPETAAPAPAPEPAPAAEPPMPQDPIHSLIPPGTPNPHTTTTTTGG